MSILHRTSAPAAVVTSTLASALLLLLPSCGDDQAATPSVQDPPLIDTDIPAGFPRRSIKDVAPPDNALTEERAQLGKRLFFDPRLSRTGQISCGSCHRQEQGFADGLAVSSGVDGRKGIRNAPALSNLAWGESFFWDGRAPTLEDQAGQPIENPDEMDLPLADAVARVGENAAYRRAFIDAYGGVPSEASLRKAIASFVRTMVSADSAYDRHLRGDDSTFGEAEQRGEMVFTGIGGCFHCHPVGRLTNEGFFNNGTYEEGGDRGRQALTGRSGDLGKFKVPGLRNVAASAPYMHDGSVPTLEAVVEQYDRGGRGHASTDPQIERLSLSDVEKLDLLAFLRALTDSTFLTDGRYRP